MKHSLRLLFVLLIAQPIARLWLGITVRNLENLPQHGPAIVAANHNSHLDILALYALFPIWRIPGVQPAAAADYFLRNPLISWFSRHVVGIIPVPRGKTLKGGDPLAACSAALAAGQILILFPEGSRGEPEQLADIKSGLWYLAQRHPEAPITPVYMHGLGRAMGKGCWAPVPFFVDIIVDTPFPFQDNRPSFKTDLKTRFEYLRSQTEATIAPSLTQDN